MLVNKIPCEALLVLFVCTVPVFSVANTSVSVMEDAGNVMICVNLTGPAGGLERSVEASLQPTEGTARSKHQWFIRYDNFKHHT